MMDQLGFCKKWRGWIMECLSSATTSILVNGSPTEEIHLKCGLRQGDPLSPFLFLIVAEGLVGLMRQASSMGFFSPYKVGSEKIHISLLQYVDDAILIGDCSPKFFWVMKSILHLFELSFGLKINFSKSNLYGVNIGDDHLKWLADFLHCKLFPKSFTYLGISVGVSHKSKHTWKPLLREFSPDFLHGKLIRSPLVVGASLNVIQSIQKIQRNFLWGETNCVRKIHWVKWDRVCKSKLEGGLGVKDIHFFNVALLGKWKWRLVTESDSLWCRVLFSKYGRVSNNSWVGFRTPISKQSVWARDLGFTCSSNLINSNWVWKGLIRCLGDGSHTSFWYDSWLRESNFSLDIVGFLI
ncbi:putative RNA-directed DNA polymerase [Lupinus albus]|uniref:Putative RNA-directed DNA polymerase n=1 Tax=Lupinus albus TaxID=3870 RepID=A0A6A4NBW3_LUPAL|nr:putative RNA-directed DNA polymerase [Lupinus albus]